MGAVQSLWDQKPCYWEQLPDELQERIYREAVNNLSPRELMVQRQANAPGTYNHWLRTSPIGPELERKVRNEASLSGIPEKGASLMLKDIVNVITRYEAYARMPLRPPLRPAILPVDVRFHHTYGSWKMRIHVRYLIDWSSIGEANEMSPWLVGREFTAAELGIEED